MARSVRRALVFVVVLVQFGFCRGGDWCHKWDAVANSSLKLTDVLRGERISVTYINVNNVGDAMSKYVNGKWEGFLPDVLAQIAQLGGFAIAANYSSGPSANQDYTQWARQCFDDGAEIVSDWFYDTVARHEMNCIVPAHFMDVSMVSVLQTPPVAEVNWWDAAFTFNAPFTTMLWTTLSLATMATSFAYFALERNEWKLSRRSSIEFPDKVSRQWTRGFFQSMMKSTLMFTGAGAGIPITMEGQIVLASWSFITLLVVAAYTANLTSFMMFRAMPGPEIESLAEAVVRMLALTLTLTLILILTLNLNRSVTEAIDSTPRFSGSCG